MSLLIGKKYTSFYSKNLRDLDAANDTLMKKYHAFKTPRVGWQGYEIRRNIQDKTLLVNNRIPFTSEVSQYSEELPKMKWNIVNETDTVMGYFCKKATLTYDGGQCYIVWFAKDIPLSYGPWKFYGLPGLIMKIGDTENNFLFECIGLNQQPQSIVDYAWKYKKVSKSEWCKFEKNMYEHAGRFVTNIGARVLIVDDSEKGSHPLPEQLSAFYNPIER